MARGALTKPAEGQRAWASGLAGRLIAHGYGWQDELVPMLKHLELRDLAAFACVGYRYTMVEDGNECQCGNTLPPTQITATQCSTRTARAP